MIQVDMWNGAKPEEADKIDISFYANDAQYRGNIYVNGEIAGDYVCDDSIELQNAFPQLDFDWEMEIGGR